MKGATFLMATSTFGTFLKTNDAGNSVRVRYIKTWIENIAVEHVGTVIDSGKYGVNGTYFGATPIQLLGIAVNNGVAVYTGGNVNAIHRGTLYRLTNGTVGVQPVTNASSITGSMSDLRWAIGGISLYLERTYTSPTAYWTDIDSEIGQVDVKSNLPRTAIGFDGGNQIYLVTVMSEPTWTNRDGVDLFELHQILKNDLRCVKGVNLDGGGSTAIAYIRPSSDQREVVAVKSDTTVYSMVTVPRLSFSNVLP